MKIDFFSISLFFLLGIHISTLLFNWLTAAISKSRHFIFLSGITLHTFALYFVLTGVIHFSLLLLTAMIYPTYGLFISPKDHNSHSCFYLSRPASKLAIFVILAQTLLTILGLVKEVIALSVINYLFYSWNLSLYLLKFKDGLSAIKKGQWIVYLTLLLISIFYISTAIYTDQWQTALFNSAFLFISILGTAITFFYLKNYYLLIDQKSIEQENLYRKNLAVISANKTLKERLFSLENKALNNQINPHFLFNAMNSINSLIITEKLEQANIYLSQLSLFLENTLAESKSSFITIEKELQLLDIYLSLENLRRNVPITFTKNISNQIKTKKIFIPYLFLQSILENAIWHGLADTKNGTISLNIDSIKNNIVLILEDNGVGINSANNNTKSAHHKSAGLDILRNRLVTLQEYFSTNTVLEITDISDTYPLNGSGTRVKIIIPLISEAPLSRSLNENLI